MDAQTTDIAGLVRSVVEPLVEYKDELQITSGFDSKGSVWSKSA